MLSPHENNVDQFPVLLIKKMFPSNGKQTTMADGEGEIEEKGKKERNRTDEDRELITH